MKYTAIIKKLNLEQKCALLSGDTVFTTRAYPKAGFVAKVGIGNYTHHFFFRHGEVVVGTGHAFLLFYVPGAAACSGGQQPVFY